jgi:hypothetical protein
MTADNAALSEERIAEVRAAAERDSGICAPICIPRRAETTLALIAEYASLVAVRQRLLGLEACLRDIESSITRFHYQGNSFMVETLARVRRGLGKDPQE